MLPGCVLQQNLLGIRFINVYEFIIIGEMQLMFSNEDFKFKSILSEFERILPETKYICHNIR